MLLAIDIGNTSINLGIFTDGNLTKKWKVCSDNLESLLNLIEKEKDKIEEVVISSVVPFLCQRVEENLKKKFLKTLVVGRDIDISILNLYQNPREVGIDRLVDCLAAAEIYGFPIIVVDFGTAITFNLVSQNKEYLGGIIVPGIKLSMEALSKKAALLPTVNLTNLNLSPSLLGKNTIESMLSGTVYGFANLCDGIVKKIRKKYGENILCIGTGGDISFVAPYCSQIDKIDEDLNLKGLWVVYSQKNKKNG